MLSIHKVAGVVSFAAPLVLFNTSAAGYKDLLHEYNPRVYVADLPRKYNMHTIVREGCTEGQFLETLLSNILGTLLSESLDAALYRCVLLQAAYRVVPL